MHIPSLTALLIPIIFLGFGLPLLLIYSYDRARIEALWWGVAYCLAGLGFFSDFLRPSMPHFLDTYLSNGLYLAAASFIAHGFARRYQSLWPDWLNAGLAVLTLAALIWFDVVNDDINFRTLAIHLGVTAVLLTSLPAIRPKRFRIIDKVLWVLVLVSGLQFGVRAVAVMAATGFVLTEENYVSSFFMTLTHLFVAFFGLILAIALLAAVAIDVVSELDRKSMADSLSGVLNRRGFEKSGLKLVQDALRLNRPVAISICDIDYFKAINDTHGHVFGDGVIAAMGRILRENVRGADCAGRIGGEEFAVVMFDADAKDAERLSDRLREAFAACAFETETGPVHFTASFGVAQARAGELLERAVARADAALYEAKNSGRDAVVVSEPERRFRVV